MYFFFLNETKNSINFFLTQEKEKKHFFIYKKVKVNWNYLKK